MKDNTEKNILEVRKKIREYEYFYYVLAESKVSDYEYDQLYKELELLEEQHPEFITPESPTQRVGSDLTKDFQSVQHKTPMLSLANSYEESELIDFDKRIKNLLKTDNDIEYTTELKIDGVSVSIIYENGKLKQASTRGDGISGEDITTNIKTIKSVPLEIYSAGEIPSPLEVRGEVFMEVGEFSKFNELRKEQGLKQFANPRNSTAGTLKLQDPQMVASRPLDIFTYYMLSDNQVFESQYNNLQKLTSLGFKVNKNFSLCQNINEVLDYCKYWDAKRNNLPYETDGVVVKVNNIEYQNKLGNVAKSPRWAIAFKFAAQQTKTKLKSITWQVGRTGAVTPVAELESVFLAGSTISRATLHNKDEIKRKDIRESDIVIIEKGGDVIPKIISVDLEERKANSKETLIPRNCPICGEKLFSPKDEVAIYCENLQCPAKLKGQIEHFASRGAMDIEGLGESLVEQFVDMRLLSSYVDIYYLKKKRDTLIGIERLGEKSVDNLLEAIEKSKKTPFEKVLFALGIRYVGTGAAKKLVNEFKTIDNIITASKETIENIPEIGPSIAESITQYFQHHENLENIKKLKAEGLNFQSEEKTNDNNNLDGLTFVITGSLSNYSRDEAKAEIEARGGKITSSISKKTNFLLVGKNAGSKLEKAVKLNVEILNENDFQKLLTEK